MPVSGHTITQPGPACQQFRERDRWRRVAPECRGATADVLQWTEIRATTPPAMGATVATTKGGSDVGPAAGGDDSPPYS